MKVSLWDHQSARRIWYIYTIIMAFFELDSQTIKLALGTFSLKRSTAYHKPTTSRTRAIVSSALAFALTAPWAATASRYRPASAFRILWKFSRTWSKLLQMRSETNTLKFCLLRDSNSRAKSSHEVLPPSTWCMISIKFDIPGRVWGS